MNVVVIQCTTRNIYKNFVFDEFQTGAAKKILIFFLPFSNLIFMRTFSLTLQNDIFSFMDLQKKKSDPVYEIKIKKSG
jgi:hypothetical protein